MKLPDEIDLNGRCQQGIEYLGTAVLQEDGTYRVLAKVPTLGGDQALAIVSVKITLYSDKGLPELATKTLKEVPGIEAAFIRENQVYAVAREHSDIDWDALVRAEDILVDYFSQVEVLVRARQKRPLSKMLSSYKRLF